MPLVFDLYFTFNQEHERERFVAKCTMLQKKNSEMSKRMAELEEVIICGCAVFSLRNICLQTQ